MPNAAEFQPAAMGLDQARSQNGTLSADTASESKVVYV
jgi:hypothetical protein